MGTFLFSIFILFSSIPSLRPEELKGFPLVYIFKASKKYPQLIFGAIVMFFYMGAEVGTAGFFINYLRDSDLTGFTVEKASRFLTYYYIASTVFCIAGIFLLQYISPGKLIAAFGTGMIILYLLISLSVCEWNPYYLIGIGALISVLFPTIFSLGIEGAGTFTEKGSALINMAIVGGAVFPPLQGILADSKGIQISYLIPCFCCVFIVIYGIYCHKRNKMKKSMNIV
jgi:FHS family L-fucose permease-like MFS transporter